MTGPERAVLKVAMLLAMAVIVFFVSAMLEGKL